MAGILPTIETALAIASAAAKLVATVQKVIANERGTGKGVTEPLTPENAGEIAAAVAQHQQALTDAGWISSGGGTAENFASGGGARNP